MKRNGLIAAMACVAFATAQRAPAADFSFTVDPAAPWQAYMNWFDLSNAYVSGSPWGVADLTASFSGSTLTLGPNSINDPSPYWYTPSGGPGAAGAKNMDANMYIEFPAGTHNGDTITFAGTVLASSLTSAHVATAFIRDFEPNYGSYVHVDAPLTPGPFSITLPTIADPLHHVQYGFNMYGVDVWITDVAPFGSVQVTSNVIPGDFDHSGVVDHLDLDMWRTAFASTAAGDADADGDSDGNDFIIWQNHQTAGAVAATGSVPEPVSGVLAVVGLVGWLGARRRWSTR